MPGNLYRAILHGSPGDPKAAAYSLMTLGADPHYVGGKIAILAVLHTWTRALHYHPHVHLMVPGGGLSEDGSWNPSRKNFLVPVRALSPIFRAKFMEMARKALPEEELPRSVWNTSWVVYSKPAAQGAEKVLNYLARYVHRIAITNNRILSIDDDKVRFRYKDSKKQCWKTMTLPAQEFIRRFLQHVLPARFHKVRYFGLFSPSNRRIWALIQSHFEQKGESEPEYRENDEKDDVSPPRSSVRCLECKNGFMILIAVIPCKKRYPP